MKTIKSKLIRNFLEVVDESDSSDELQSKFESIFKKRTVKSLLEFTRYLRLSVSPYTDGNFNIVLTFEHYSLPNQEMIDIPLHKFISQSFHWLKEVSSKEEAKQIIETLEKAKLDINKALDRRIKQLNKML